MNALSPLARAFVDQTIQSAALHQKHRAQIWARLQQRVLAESSKESPSHSPEASLHRFALKSRVGWAGFFVASGAMLASVLGTGLRFDRASNVAPLEACSAVPKESREASLAPSAIAAPSTQATPPAVALASKQALGSGPRPKKRPVSLDTRGTFTHERLRRSPIPSSQVASLVPHRDLQTVSVERSKGSLRSDPGYDLTHTAIRRSGAQFGVSPEWLEFAPPLVGGFSPLGEGRFESLVPLKLTQPQLRLTATLLE